MKGRMKKTVLKWAAEQKSSRSPDLTNKPLPNQLLHCTTAVFPTFSLAITLSLQGGGIRMFEDIDKILKSSNFRCLPTITHRSLRFHHGQSRSLQGVVYLLQPLLQDTGRRNSF